MAPASSKSTWIQTGRDAISTVTVQKDTAGHRKRLRERFLTGVEGSHSDEAVLELLLTYAIIRKDVKPLAQQLLRTYDGLGQVLAAPPKELSKIKGMGVTSVALLKAVHFAATEYTVAAVEPPQSSGVENTEPPSAEKQSMKEHSRSNPKQADFSEDNKVGRFASTVIAAPSGAKSQAKNSTKKSATKKIIRRKFQVCNGYLLEFDQLARVLHFLLENRNAKKISRDQLIENTGLSNRQIESLVSIGCAMGLIQPGKQTLTEVGFLIAQHDVFIESRGSLEWCHYAGSGNYKNIIWYEVFNTLLPEENPVTQEGWMEFLRRELAGQYTDRTIGKHLYEEVRFVVDAYMERKLKKLGLLHKDQNERLYVRRYTQFNPMVLSAMIYNFGANMGAQLFQIGEMVTAPSSPPRLFGLDIVTFREQIELLHDRGWLRYETTHNLDQIRLKSSFSWIEFLSAYFEDRGPRQGADAIAEGLLE